MYRVEIIKKCGCFTKSGLEAEYVFPTHEQASKKAEEIVIKFNDEFCGKHKFLAQTEGNTIKIVEDEDA